MYVDVTSFFLLIFYVVVLLYNLLCIHSLLYKKYCLKEKNCYSFPKYVFTFMYGKNTIVLLRRNEESIENKIE